MLFKIPTGNLSKMLTKCPTASPKRSAILITPINKLVGVILLVDPQKKPIKKTFFRNNLVIAKSLNMDRLECSQQSKIVDKVLMTPLTFLKIHLLR